MKRTIVYASIAVLLVLIFLIQETTGREKNTLTVAPLPETLDMIVMEQNSSSLELSAGTDVSSDDFSGWKIGPEQLPASEEAVSALADAVDAIGSADIISTRESYSKFGLDGGTERIMRFLAEGKEVLTLHFGNEASSGGFVYGRIDDRREVVLLPRDLDNQFTLEVMELREKQMASIPQDAIKRIVVSSPGRSELLISRIGAGDTTAGEGEAEAGGGTSDAGGTEADEADESVDEINAEPEWEARFAGADSAEEIDPGRFRDFFIELADMRAAGFPGEDPQSEPWADLAIFRQDGNRVTVSFWPPDADGEFPVMVSTNPYSFTLPKWKARRLFLGIDSYFEPFEE